MGKRKPIIPEWLQDLVSYAKFLPIEKRKQVLKGVMTKLDDKALSAIVHKDNVQGARFLSHFLTGSGEPMKLEVSDKEWEKLIKASGINKTPKWMPTTNPKYPASKGYEYKQVWTQHNIPPHLHNVLGVVTTLRRQKVPGGYNYEVVENFDLHPGQIQKDEKGFRSSRELASGEAVRLITAVFPEYIATSDKERVSRSGKTSRPGMRREVPPTEIFTKTEMADAGTPFPIQSTYFQADDKNVKVKPYKSYLTKLSAGDEQEFQVWFDRYVREVHGPLIRMKPDEKEQYYDYRGYWKDNRGEAGKPMERGMHLTDDYKIPGHPTFSIESKYYQPGMEKNTKVIQWINNKPVRIGSQQ